MALALPKRFVGKAFHWHPVRSTCTMLSKTCRAGFRGRPASGLRTYFLSGEGMRWGAGGSTCSQNASVTTHARFAIVLSYAALHAAPTGSIVIYG